MGYYSAKKVNQTLTHATTRLSLENIVLSELNQTEKGKYCLNPLTLNL